MRIRDPKPEIQRLEELVYAIRNGEIRLPKFQRPFVWQKKDVLNLFDSIYNGYPIGSILIWNSSERLSSEREIIGFKLSKSAGDNYPTNYLLDGQQRLTSLCATLFWDGNSLNSIWNICFDLDTETFVYPKDGEKTNLFPMNRLLSTSDFIKQCMKFEHSRNSTEYYEKAERLLKSFKDYKIAVVKIGDVGLDEVAPIFERINSTGRKLTVVDLMRAATWKNGFDLTQSIDNITKKYEDNFGEIPDTLILRIISAATDLGINKADIDKLRDKSSDTLRKAIDVTNVAIENAIAFLNKYTSVSHISYLPYSLQLILISEYFRINQSPSDIDLERLAKWFWKTSFSRYFGGSSTGQISRDLLSIRNFATSKNGDIEFNEIPIEFNAILYDEFNLRTASSKVFALMLKQNVSKIEDGSNISIELERSQFVDILQTAHNNTGKNISRVLYPTLPRTANKHNFPDQILSANFFNNLTITDIIDKNIDSVLKKRALNITNVATQLSGLDIGDFKI